MCIHQCQKATLLLLFRFHGLLLPCLALCTFVSPGVRVSPCVRLCVPVLGRVCARVLLSLRVRVRPRMSRVPVGAPVSVPARSARVRDTPRRCPCPWRARPLAPPRGGTQPALLGAGAGRGGVSAARPRGSRAAAPAVLSPRARCARAAPTRLPRPVAPVGREEPPHGFRTTPSVRPRSRPRLSERRCSGAALWRAPAAPPRPRRVVVRERQLHGASTKFVAFFPSSPPAPCFRG